MAEGDVEQFDVKIWISDDQQEFVPVVKPKVVSCWTKKSSTTGGGYEYGSDAGLPVFQRPNLPVNLGAGYPDQYIKGDNDTEATPVEVIIRGAKHAGIDLSSVKVCTFRNNLNKLMLTPLSQQEEWVVDACSHNGTLFLDIFKTPQAAYPNADLFTYYGYKFEAACTGDNQQVDSTSEFALLLSLKLGAHRILMAAEVDCMSPQAAEAAEAAESGRGAGQEGRHAPGPGPAGHSPDQFMELKTVRWPRDEKSRQRVISQRLPKWWVQSFLAGIPTMVVGGRDDNGQLKEIFEMPVASLPSRAARDGKPFDAWQLLRFADSALSWMSELGEARPGQHMRFRYLPRDQSIQMSVVEEGQLGNRLAKELPLGKGAAA